MRSTSRRTDGAPGDFIGDRPVNSFIQPAGLPINTSTIEALRRPVESTQFTSWGFSENLRRWGLLESFGTVGDCFDNAVMESFWDRMQTELLDTKKWSTTMELTMAMADYIDNFHNTERRHSYLGNTSPAEYEKLWEDIQPSPQLS